MLKYSHLTKPVFARKLGFKGCRDKRFRELIKLALEKNYIRIVQSGYLGHSTCHHKVIELNKSFNMIVFLNNIVFPSYMPKREVEGYILKLERTGFKRILKKEEFSGHKWYICEDCKKKIQVGQPYASKVDFSFKKRGEGLPIRCKCLPCFLNLIDEFYFT